MLLDYLVDQNHIDIEKSDINFIGDLILGKTPSLENEKSNLLF